MGSGDWMAKAIKSAKTATDCYHREEYGEAAVAYLEAASCLTQVVDSVADKKVRQKAAERAQEYICMVKRIRQRKTSGEGRCRESQGGGGDTGASGGFEGGRDEDSQSPRDQLGDGDGGGGDGEDAVVGGRSPGSHRPVIRDEEVDEEVIPTYAPNEVDGSVKVEDLIGMGRAKELFESRLGMPILFPQLFKPYGAMSRSTGLLLYGPPGTGKTQLVNAIASLYKCPLYVVTPADVVDKWVGDSPKNIREVFAAARALSVKNPDTTPIIFIDEIDCLAAKRDSSDSESSKQIKAELLNQMTICTRPTAPVIVIGATNRPGDIDDAVMRRLPTHIYAPLPDVGDREKILRKVLGGLGAQLSDADYSAAAAVTDMYSGADLVSLAGTIQERVLGRLKDCTHMRWVKGPDDVQRMQPCSPGAEDAFPMAAMETDRPGDVLAPPIQASDLRASLAERKPTATAAMVAEYTQWQERR